MAVISHKASQIGIEKAKRALTGKSWSYDDLAHEIGTTRQPVQNFFNGKGVSKKNFVAICEKLELDWEEIGDLPPLSNAIANTIGSTLIDNQLNMGSKDDIYNTQTLKNTEQEMVVRVSSLRNENADLRATVAFIEEMALDSGLQSFQDSVEAISNLFLIRDKSVLSRDNKSFLETQLNKQEILKGSSSGYLKCSKMTTIVLKIVSLKSASNLSINSLNYSVLVREDYEHNYKFSHSAYINYHIVEIDNTLKISSLKSLKY
jgi:DNA-binding Xre family transcriptional regulator